MRAARIGMVVGIVGALIAAPSVSAAAAQQTRITLDFDFVSGDETFSMDGVVDCAHGTSVSDPSSATFGGSQNRGRFTFHVVKTLTCDDPIGTFKLLVDVAQNADRSGTTGGFTAGEGTGAFAGIRGGGEIHGTNYPDGSGITDVYTGRLTIAP